MADELVKVRYGLNSQLPTVKDDNTLYFVTDSKKIYRGDVDYTGNIQNITINHVSDGAIGVNKMTISFKDGSASIIISVLSFTAVEAIVNVLKSTATGTTKGLVTLSDATNSTSGVSGGIAATPKAVSDALESAKNYTDEQIAAGFAANDAMVFKGTIGADGTITSSDTAITNKKISAITGYSAGWTFRVTAASTSALWSGDASTKVEVGDMVLAIKDYGTSNVSTDWSIIQSNLIGAVTTDATDSLTADQVVLGNGTQKVKILSAGANNQVLTIVNGKPTWANLPTEKDTTYTFVNGTDGSFTVTPLGGSAQKVTIGKPATAGTADVAEVANKGNISGTATAFGAAAAKGVSTTIANNQNLITAAAVNTWKTSVDTWQGEADDKFDELYDALTWKSFATA